MKISKKVVMFVAFGLIAACSGALAIVNREDRLIVQYDPGGLIAERGEEVERFRVAGKNVYIIGSCYSSCTMYLYLDKTCVAKHANLGFHGPSLRGVPLSPSDFEATSQYMAAHYPPKLKEWFLTIGRYEVKDYITFSGKEMNEKFDIPLCKDGLR